MVLNIWLWFYNTDLYRTGLHVVIPEKQFTEACRINLRDTGEIQYDMVTAHFFDPQDQHLNACFGVTIKLACETEDFYLVLFTNLKHGGMYLRL